MIEDNKLIKRRFFLKKISLNFVRVVGIPLVLPTISIPVFAKKWKELDVTVVPPLEDIDSTLKRLFGDKKIKYTKTRLNYVTPNVAENGAVVPVKVDLNEDIVKGNYVKKIYFIIDKNKRPQALTYEFTPDTGYGHAAGYLRMGQTSWIRVIFEFKDGFLLASKRQVKVVVGGCGG